MDKIEELLKGPKTDLQKQALTDTSYKNIDHSLSDDDTNAELATYGDAVMVRRHCSYTMARQVVTARYTAMLLLFALFLQAKMSEQPRSQT